ncbi:hypothetical protein LTR36_007340 [Oleoguttula mirabilis]|uniref:Uncharacterized protein n=1 Tax=Oleoguttula mirabilis TaxID=1507867 RepID=A0AAV9JBN3_9PEZI|nr:hypothetical protein LTR36_007340 [Oleoguttula mirabilis]
MSGHNLLFPANLATEKPGSYQHRLEVLENIFSLIPAMSDLDTEAVTANDCYGRIEEILAGLLSTYNITLDIGTTPEGKHAYHEKLISKFAEASTPAALRQPLGSGPIQGVLGDCKTFRNDYKNYMAGTETQAGLWPSLVAAVGGLPLVIKAVKVACHNASVMDKILIPLKQ